MGTNGAPCPPAATSATRKSATVVIRVRSAMTATSPIWSVLVTCPCASTSCQMVCPCEPIRSTSSGERPAAAMTANAARAKPSPRAKLARQSVCTVDRPSKRSKIKARSSARHSSATKARCRTWIWPSTSSISASTASIASADVPLIRPTTNMTSPFSVGAALIHRLHGFTGLPEISLCNPVNPCNLWISL